MIVKVSAHGGRRGRPISPGGAKLMPLNMRTTKSIRAKIEAAAAENGQNIAQTVERIIESHFAHETEVETAFGDMETYRLMLSFANIAQMLTRGADKPWYEDAALIRQAFSIWLGIDMD